MKGVILAGGLGTRLYPLTKITNKHLLPIYDRPLIYYSIQTLVASGIKDLMVVTGGNHAGDFLKLLGSGEGFGLKHIDYTYQENEGGIGEALALCENFVNKDNVIVMLADNIVEGNFKKEIINFNTHSTGAHLFLKEVNNPKEYGIAEIGTDNNIIHIEEKPKNPKSNLAVTGIYIYDAQVFDILRGVSYSARNELEITDVNNTYLQLGILQHSTIRGYWADAGESIEAYNNTIQLIKNNV